MLCYVPLLVRLWYVLQTAQTIPQVLEHQVDPSIIAGVVTEVDGRVFDGSVRTSLAKMGARLRADI